MLQHHLKSGEPTSKIAVNTTVKWKLIHTSKMHQCCWVLLFSGYLLSYLVIISFFDPRSDLLHIGISMFPYIFSSENTMATASALFTHHMTCVVSYPPGLVTWYLVLNGFSILCSQSWHIALKVCTVEPLYTWYRMICQLFRAVSCWEDSASNCATDSFKKHSVM